MAGKCCVFLVLYLFCACSCSANGKWKKYDFNPSFGFFSERGKIAVKSDIIPKPVRGRHAGNPIESLAFTVPSSGEWNDSVEVRIYSKDGWHSLAGFEFYVDGIANFAKQYPSLVDCNFDQLCKVSYSTVSSFDRGKALSYMEYMSSANIDTFAYVDKSLIANKNLSASEKGGLFFMECQLNSGCLRRLIFKDYFIEYKLKDNPNQLVSIDLTIKEYLSDNVKFY